MLADVILKLYRAKAGKKLTAESFQEALEKTDGFAQAFVEAVEKSVPAGTSQEEIMEGLSPGLAELYQNALEVSKQAQRVHNKEAEIGLEPLEIEMDEYRLRGLLEKLSESESIQNGEGVSEEEKLQVRNLANSAVDETIKRNSEFQSNSGITVKVTRHYDGRGLKGGVCQWCLARAGRDVPYKDALARGMFQRHPGCGCSLTYVSEKGRFHQADWTKNSWAESADTLESRKKYGLE